MTLKVGSVAETVTVSGASPVVDVTTTRGGQTINTLVVSQSVPLVGHEADVVRLTPGLSGGVGTRSGNPTQVGLQGNMSLSAYGQTGVTAQVEDFEMHSNNQPPNLTDTEQMDVKTYGTTADIQFPGAAINYRSEETRLNSSHQIISYAVFCLKKKIQYTLTIAETTDAT